MPYYQDSQQLYSALQALFVQIQRQSPAVIEKLAASGLRARLVFPDLKAEISLDARQRPLKIGYGASDLPAGLEIVLTSEQLHRILLDEYSIREGFASGDLRVRGPIWNALRFVEVFTQGRVFYPQVLRDLEGR